MSIHIEIPGLLELELEYESNPNLQAKIIENFTKEIEKIKITTITNGVNLQEYETKSILKISLDYFTEYNDIKEMFIKYEELIKNYHAIQMALNTEGIQVILVTDLEKSSPKSNDIDIINNINIILIAKNNIYHINKNNLKKELLIKIHKILLRLYHMSINCGLNYLKFKINCLAGEINIKIENTEQFKDHTDIQILNILSQLNELINQYKDITHQEIPLTFIYKNNQIIYINNETTETNHQAQYINNPIISLIEPKEIPGPVKHKGITSDLLLSEINKIYKQIHEETHPTEHMPHILYPKKDNDIIIFCSTNHVNTFKAYKAYKALDGIDKLDMCNNDKIMKYRELYKNLQLLIEPFVKLLQITENSALYIGLYLEDNICLEHIPHIIENDKIIKKITEQIKMQILIEAQNDQYGCLLYIEDMHIYEDITVEEYHQHQVALEFLNFIEKSVEAIYIKIYTIRDQCNKINSKTNYHEVGNETNYYEVNNEATYSKEDLEKILGKDIDCSQQEYEGNDQRDLKIFITKIIATYIQELYELTKEDIDFINKCIELKINSKEINQRIHSPYVPDIKDINNYIISNIEGKLNNIMNKLKLLHKRNTQ